MTKVVPVYASAIVVRSAIETEADPVFSAVSGRFGDHPVLLMSLKPGDLILSARGISCHTYISGTKFPSGCRPGFHFLSNNTTSSHHSHFLTSNTPHTNFDTTAIMCMSATCPTCCESIYSMFCSQKS